MTSRVSFISLTKENMKRRLPSFVISFVLFIFVLPISFAMTIQELLASVSEKSLPFEEVQEWFVGGMTQTSSSWIFIVAMFGILLAFSGFKYLYDKSAVDLFHSTPVKREKMFLSIYLTGFLIFAIPYVLCSALTLLLGMIKGVSTATAVVAFGSSLLINILGFLNFYTLTIIAIVLTGTSLTGILATGTLIGLPILLRTGIYMLLQSFIPTFVFGNKFYDSWGTFIYSSPVLSYMYAGWEGASQTDFLGRNLIALRYIGIPLIIFFVLAFICYKMRPSEGAGNSIAFEKVKKPLKVILVTIFSLDIGLSFKDMTLVFQDGWMFFGVIIGAILIGCIIEIIYWSEFKKLFRNIAMTGVGVVIAIASILVIKYDVFGIDKAIPTSSEIQSCVVEFGFINDGDLNSRSKFNTAFTIPGSTKFSKLDMKLTNTKPVLEIAQISYENSKNPKNLETDGSIFVQYNLKNGQTIKKRYLVPIEKVKTQINEIFLDKEYKEETFPCLGDDFEYDTMVVYSSKGKNKDVNKEHMQVILDTYRKELYTLDINNVVDTPIICTITAGNKENGCTMDVSAHFKETLELLEKYGYNQEIKISEADVSSADVTVFKFDDDMEYTNSDVNNISITAPEDIKQILENGYCSQVLGTYYCGPSKVGADIILNMKNPSSPELKSIAYRIDSDKLPDFLKKYAE